MFQKKGRIAFDKTKVDEDKLFEIAIEVGADDVRPEDSEVVVITSPENMDGVKAEIDRAGLKYLSSEVTMIPQNSVRIEGKEAEQMLRLMEAFDESDDVQNVYSNFDISEELLEAMG
jgi:transcriptional/translational regulatory protein YebC/TACO1